MKTTTMLMAVVALLFIGCADETANEHIHGNLTGELAPLSYTLYSDQTELFVEFEPLVVGDKTNFAAHFTILGERFLPLTEGEVTVSLIIGEDGIRNTANSASSPGIFRLALIPKKAGNGKLLFDIKAENYTDRIVLDGITVFPNDQIALENQTEIAVSDEITYLKEQAWKVEFANTPVVKTIFHHVIKAGGKILSAPDDEVVITANADGILNFSGSKTIVGSEVNQGTQLFTISGGNLAENNLNAAYLTAKADFEKAQKDFERAKELIVDQLISKAAYQQAKITFDNAQTVFNTRSRNYSPDGFAITSPIHGFLKDLLVDKGQFVETGMPLAVIFQNRKLILQAEVSQKYFSQIPSITSAKFRIIGSDRVFDTEALNGRLTSYGKSVSLASPFLPVTFEMMNNGEFIPGSMVEIFLKSSPIPNALVVPVSALLEEQGNLYVHVQTGGESFQKRAVTTGANNGEYVQILSGIEEGERVVTTGTYQIKLSSASGELPAHGHEH